jgi:hypothetical protein
MTYSTSWPEHVTKAEAIRELRRHSASPEEFFEDAGEHDVYPSETVLRWLGY